MRKIDLPIAGSIGILCLIFQSTSVLAEPSQLAGVEDAFCATKRDKEDKEDTEDTEDTEDSGDFLDALSSCQSLLNISGESELDPSYQIRVDYPLVKKAGGAGEVGGEERGVIKTDLGSAPDLQEDSWLPFSPSSSVSSEQLVVAETASPTVPEAEVSVEDDAASDCCQEANEVPEPTPPIAQTEPLALPQEQTTPIVTLEGEVTSVNQLSDVQPTDWAFQALQSLMEHYGAIAGYPDGTFQGNRSMTRYEFAAALKAALQRVNALTEAGLANRVSRDDLATLQRLQDDFATELATLEGQVDALEARAVELEATQFSTTTKLSGQAIFAVSGGGFSGDSSNGDSSASRIVDVTGREIATEDPNPTFIYRAGLDLDTSFHGTDLLKIRLDQGSNGPNDHAAGFLEPNFGSVLDFSSKPPVDNFAISRLYYTFRPFEDVTLSLGPRITATDYVDWNRYANLSFLDFSTQALVNNYILFPVQGLGPGAAVAWNPNNSPFTVRAVYIALAGDNPSSDSPAFIPGVFPIGSTLYPNGSGKRGLFGDPNQGIVELEYSPSQAFTLRFHYSGGNVLDGRFDVFGANFELALSDRIAVFGRYGYGSYKDTAFGDINPNYWMAGIAFPDLFMPGTRTGIAIGQPFIASEIGNATQTNIEAFYNFPVTNNIRITPLVQVIINAANQDANGTIVTGTLRTVFSF